MLSSGLKQLAQTLPSIITETEEKVSVDSRDADLDGVVPRSISYQANHYYKEVKNGRFLSTI